MIKTDILDLFEIIQSRIVINYPSVNVEINHEDSEDEYYISIDDSDIYYSNSYQELITSINLEIIWPKNIIGIYFIYDESQDFPNLSYSYERTDFLTQQYEYKLEYFLTVSNNVNLPPVIDKAA